MLLLHKEISVHQSWSLQSAALEKCLVDKKMQENVFKIENIKNLVISHFLESSINSI